MTTQQTTQAELNEAPASMRGVVTRLAAAQGAWSLVVAVLGIYSVIASVGASVTPYQAALQAPARWLLSSGACYLALTAIVHCLLSRALRLSASVVRANVASVLVAHLAVLIAGVWSLSGGVQSRGLLVGLASLLTCLTLVSFGSILLTATTLLLARTASSVSGSRQLRGWWLALVTLALAVLLSTFQLESRPLGPTLSQPATQSQST